MKVKISAKVIKKTVLVMACAFVLGSLTGCWSRKELNELGIVTMMGIDKVGKKFLVTIQLVNPGEIATQKGGGNRSVVTTYQATGDTIFQSIRKLSTQSPRTNYFSHLQMLIVGEDLAKEGIEKSMDMLSRDHEFRTDFYLAIAKNTRAEDVLKIFTPVEKIPSTNLYSKLENSEKVWAGTGAVKLDDWISSYLSKGRDPIITGIQIIGDPTIGNTQKNLQMVNAAAKLKFSNIAAFHKGKMIAWLTEGESKGYNYTQNGRISSTIVQIPYHKAEFVDVEILRTKTHTKVTMDNGKPNIHVNIEAEGNIGEVQTALDITKQETIRELEQMADLEIQKKVESVFKRAQALKVDILGFGEVVHRSYPDQWKQFEKNWDEKGFLNAKIDAHTNVKIRRVGTINNPIEQPME